MKRLLFTLNLNGFLCDNARQSFMAAAERWGCDFREETLAYFPGYSPSYNKLPYLCNEDYDRILYMDGDMLIRSDAPSPFNLVKPDSIGLVPDVQDHYSPDVASRIARDVHGVHQENVCRILTSCVSGLEAYKETPFNGGFVLASMPKHSGFLGWLIQEVIRLDACYRMDGHLEQALLNLAVHVCRLASALPCTWNRIFPNVDDPVMRDFVYHFTGMDFGPERRKKIETYQWRV